MTGNIAWLLCLLAVVGADNQHFMGGECKALRMNFYKDLRRSSCKPRETMVSLMSEDSSMQIIPKKAAVMLCDGGTCLGSSSCMPTKKEIVAVSVTRRSISKGKETCGYVYLEQHTHCSCGCSVMAYHCNERQEYLPKQCICQCTNHKERFRCLEQGNMEWDPKDCMCKCKNEIGCSTGTEWVPSMCKCMRVMYDYDQF